MLMIATRDRDFPFVPAGALSQVLRSLTVPPPPLLLRQGVTKVPGTSSTLRRHYFFDSEGRRYPASSAPAPAAAPTSPSLSRCYTFDTDGRARLLTPPPPAGRGAWRPVSPPGRAPGPSSLGGLTPRVLAAREPLQAWSGRGLSRSEPRPGDGGFRARYVPPEERLSAGGGGRRSLGASPAAAQVELDRCGPEAIAVSTGV